MPKPQEIFNRIQKVKSRQKELKAMYKDALANSKQYEEVKEEIKALRDKKKQIEENIKSDFNSEFDELDQIKTEIETDTLLLSDLAINYISEGKPLEIFDEHQNRYEPVFSVKFKKS